MGLPVLPIAIGLGIAGYVFRDKLFGGKAMDTVTLQKYDVNTGQTSTRTINFKTDTNLSEFQRQEATQAAIQVVLDVKTGVTNPQGGANRFRQLGNIYAQQGFPITANSMNESAQYLEGGAFPPWVGTP